MALDWFQPLSVPFGTLFKRKKRRPHLLAATQVVPLRWLPIDYLPMQGAMSDQLAMRGAMTDRPLAMQGKFVDPTMQQ